MRAPYSSQTDLWSAGVVLLEVLSLERCAYRLQGRKSDRRSIEAVLQKLDPHDKGTILNLLCDDVSASSLEQPFVLC